MNQKIKIPVYISLIFTLLFLLFENVSPIQAQSDIANSVILTDENFVEVTRGFYGESIQDLLKKHQSPLADYKKQVGDQTFTAGDVFWITSQQEDFFINPKVILTTYITRYGMEQLPSDDLLDINRSISNELWSHFVSYRDGNRTYKLNNGQEINIGSSSNAATFALVAYFGVLTGSQADLNTSLDRWVNNYQTLYNQVASKNVDIKSGAPNVAPFLQLPFTQPSEDFLKVNSFFDHATPSVFDDSMLRFDGKSIGTASFNTCKLGVNCYGGHNGIDYSTGAGRAVLAAASGKVVYKYFNKDADQGYVDSGLLIDHGNGYITAYWHMDPISVNLGDQINAGQMVGLSGNVGKSSGAHLHFGLRITDGSKSVDPYGWWNPNVTDTWGDSKWMWAGDLVADNGEAQMQLFFRDYWNRDSAGFGGSSYYTGAMSSEAKSTNWGIWGAYLSAAGQYNVYAYWPKNSDNATGVTYRVFNKNGYNDVVVNQASAGDQWFTLGTFDFNQGSSAVILTDLNNGSGKRVYFDAIKWEKVGGSPTATAQPTATSVIPTLTPTSQATATVPAPTATPNNQVTVTATSAAPTATAVPSATIKNLAQGKSASQSSNAENASPARAVDGNTDGNYRNNSTTHTNSEAQAWWEVDLGAIGNIQYIKLWNRTDCCSDRLSNLHVLVSDAPFSSKNLQSSINQAGVSDYYYSGQVGQNMVVNVGRTGRYVRVQLTGTNILSLAEVEVWGGAGSSASSVKNDDINSAVVIPSSSSWSDQVNTSQAVTSGDDPGFACGKFTSGQGAHSVWYKFVPASSGKWSITTEGSSFDTVLAVWGGQRGLLSLNSCNDDVNYPDNVRSALQITVTAGQTYYVEVIGWGTYSSGDLKLNSALQP
ncbi:MAG: peptidoglycan DD-metalloendopeptidase family protein [Anaerolineae bacterium]|nr:peptidoglycan DD-metalloendopeptidase family protein [Anaerolineae bacterium]